MSDDTRASLKRQIEQLVYIAAGGKVSKENISQSDVDLREVGLDSLGYLNLLEALERKLGVIIDLEEEEDHSFLHTVNNIVSYVAERRSPVA